MRKSADSVALNIPEGSMERSVVAFKRFLEYSIRSLTEVVPCLYKAKRRKHISERIFNNHYKEACHLMNMMIAFKKAIQ
jgi:four helix bundle protein